jgi:DNA polymerase-3 subunit alpha
VAKPKPDQLVLLVQTEIGYRNLLKLVSRAFLESAPGDAPQVPMSLLDGHSNGLIALTAGPAGRVGRLLSEGQNEAAEAARDAFPQLMSS